MGLGKVKDAYLFTSPRLGFRNWLPKDAASWIALNEDPEVMRFFPKTLTKQESLLQMELFQKHYKENGFSFFAVDHLETAEFIGMIGFKWVSFQSTFTPAVEIGWRLARKFWNQGLATEGAQSCVIYAKSLDLERLVSFTTLENLPSQRVMQKCGMQHEGNFAHPKLPIDHPMSEHVLYSIFLNK